MEIAWPTSYAFHNERRGKSSEDQPAQGLAKSETSSAAALVALGLLKQLLVAFLWASLCPNVSPPPPTPPLALADVDHPSVLRDASLF